MKRWLALAIVLTACDGDGCYGGPDGPASKFCQDAIARAGDGGMAAADICKQCCIQEVPYKGTIENGLCVCR